MLDISGLFDYKQRVMTYRELKFEALKKGLCNEPSIERTISQMIKRKEIIVHEETVLGKKIKFYELIQ